MEKQLFDWKDWDEMDFLVVEFYNCTFNTDVGKYKKGDKVSSILMDYSNGTIKIYENLDTCVEYELSFLIHEIE